MMFIEIVLEDINGNENAYGVNVTDYYLTSSDIPNTFAMAIRQATEVMQKETGCKYAKVLKAELVAD